MTDRDRKIAERNNVLDLVEALERDILAINGIIGCDFDIRDISEIPQVILLPKYEHVDIRRDDYFKARNAILDEVIEVCRQHDLYYSGDRIEDYGTCWYMVRSCGSTWRERAAA